MPRIDYCERVTDELYDKHISGEQPLGICFLNKSSMSTCGAININDYNIDHAALAKRAQEAGYPAVICRSKSGGAHVYLHVSEPVTPLAMREKLRRLAAELGHSGAEIFRKEVKLSGKPNDIGSCIILPYFDAGRIETFCVTAENKRLTFEEYLAYAEARRLSIEEFNALGTWRWH
jgi:hypothetical protein